MKSFDIPYFYHSPLISALKTHRKKKDPRKKDFTPNILEFGKTTFILPRFHGFCYGVENAIEIAYKTIKENKEKRIFLLSEMIHNADVNKDLKSKGVQILMDTMGNILIPLEHLKDDDIVLIPAFGTTLEIEQKLLQRNINLKQYNTTCPFVEKVWNKSRSMGEENYTVIIHGKHHHEETRSTFSHTLQHSHSVIILNMQEAKLLAKYIKKEKEPHLFYEDFKGKYSDGFDPAIHLTKIGIVNQTTMLANETQEIAEYLKNTIRDYYTLTPETFKSHFSDYRDTLCYATNDNQKSIIEAIHIPADLAIVIGGYNSSNTTQLYKLCKEKNKTFYINSADDILENNTIKTYNIDSKTIEEKPFPIIENNNTQTILLSSGASCPDAIVENIMKKIVTMKEGKHVWEENNERIKAENTTI